MTTNDKQSTELERDPYVMRHLNHWLDEHIRGDTLREQVRTAMLELFDTDQEYYGSQSWWLVYDRAKCYQLRELQ